MIPQTTLNLAQMIFVGIFRRNPFATKKVNPHNRKAGTGRKHQQGHGLTEDAAKARADRRYEAGAYGRGLDNAWRRNRLWAGVGSSGH